MKIVKQPKEMDKQSDDEILNILKIDEKIQKNIYGISFRDKKIEEEYLKYYIKLNIMLKNFINFCFIINLADRLMKGIFTDILWIFIVQIILSITYLIICLCFYFAKNSNDKKFFDITRTLVNYIYNVFQLVCLMIYNQVLDLHFRTKTLFLLTSISTFEILLSSESGLIIPISFKKSFVMSDSSQLINISAVVIS